uniref:(northern house mosquito) hypothetical protein n=1 Tax=Culex pipiens TaxID=7175 RepID=A0A8D8FDH7_CULPI
MDFRCVPLLGRNPEDGGCGRSRGGPTVRLHLFQHRSGHREEPLHRADCPRLSGRHRAGTDALSGGVEVRIVFHHGAGRMSTVSAVGHQEILSQRWSHPNAEGRKLPRPCLKLQVRRGGQLHRHGRQKALLRLQAGPHPWPGHQGQSPLGENRILRRLRHLHHPGLPRGDPRRLSEL